MVDGEMVKDLKAEKPDLTKAHSGGPIWLVTWKAPGWGFEGVIDEVAVLKVVLSVDDIENIIENGLDKAFSITAVSSSERLIMTWGALRV